MIDRNFPENFQCHIKSEQQKGLLCLLWVSINFLLSYDVSFISSVEYGLCGSSFGSFGSFGQVIYFSSYISQQNFSNYRNTVYTDIPLKKFTGKKVQVPLQIILLGLSMCFLLKYIMMLFWDDNINLSVVIYSSCT